MADITTNSTSLSIVNIFVDGDTRTLTIKNPKASITSAEIEALQTYAQTNNVLIGDKTGAAYGKIGSVTKITETRTYLDIN